MIKEKNQRKMGVALSYAYIIINIIVQFLYNPFLIRMLDQSEYGIYSLAYSIIGYLTILDLGFGNAIVVFTSKYKQRGDFEKEKKLHETFKSVFIILGIISLIFGIILSFNTNLFFNKSLSNIEIYKMKILIIILSMNLFLSFYFNIYSSIITANECFLFQKILAIINVLLKPIFIIPLLFMGYKSITICIALTIINTIILLSNYYYCKIKLKIKIRNKKIDKKILKEIFSYSFFVFLTVIVDKINWSADQFILGIVAGTTAVSVYSVASQFNSLFVYLSTAISGIMLPKISKMIESNASNDEISNEFIKVGRLQYYIIFLMASSLVLFGKDFFELWAGEKYTNSYYIALILILPLCIDLIQNLGISILQAKNKHKFRSIIYIIIALFNIILSIPLAKKYAGIGAAIGTAISIFIGNGIIMNIYYKRVAKIDIKLFWINIIKMTSLFLIPLILTISIMILFPLKGIYKMLIFGPIYVITYLIISYLFVMNNYEKNIINSLLRKNK